MTPTPEPVAPPPSKPRRPADRPRTAEPTRRDQAEPGSDVVHADQAAAADDPQRQDGGDLLATVLTAPSEVHPGEQMPGQPRTPYGVFMGIRRTTDPERDLAPSAPRLPRYVLAAITLIRHATGRAQQEIIAQALTGAVPLPPEVLDAAFLELYGYPRPHVER